MNWGRWIEYIVVLLLLLPGVFWLAQPFEGISNIPVFWIFTFALSFLSPLVTLVLAFWGITILFTKQDRDGNRLKVLLLLLLFQFVFQGVYFSVWMV